VVEHGTVELEPEEFDPFAEHAAEGYTGGGYAWVVREEPPPLSDSMPEVDEAYPRVLLTLGRGADGWGPAGGGRESEALDGETPTGNNRETAGERYEEAAVREVHEETGVESEIEGCRRVRRTTFERADGEGEPEDGDESGGGDRGAITRCGSSSSRGRPAGASTSGSPN